MLGGGQQVPQTFERIEKSDLPWQNRALCADRLDDWRATPRKRTNKRILEHDRPTEERKKPGAATVQISSIQSTQPLGK